MSAVCVCVCVTGTAAILAVGASKPTVVATEDGMIGVKKMMQVSTQRLYTQMMHAHEAPAESGQGSALP